MPKIKPPTLKNKNFFWARQVPTFPVHHLLVGSLSHDGPSTDKFLKEVLCNVHLNAGNIELEHIKANTQWQNTSLKLLKFDYLLQIRFFTGQFSKICCFLEYVFIGKGRISYLIRRVNVRIFGISLNKTKCGTFFLLIEIRFLDFSSTLRTIR